MRSRERLSLPSEMMFDAVRDNYCWITLQHFGCSWPKKDWRCYRLLKINCLLKWLAIFTAAEKEDKRSRPSSYFEDIFDKTNVKTTINLHDWPLQHLWCLKNDYKWFKWNATSMAVYQGMVLNWQSILIVVSLIQPLRMLPFCCRPIWWLLTQLII